MFHYDRDLKPRKKSYYAFSKNYPGRRTGTKYAIGESRARHKRERNKNILFGVSLVVLFAVVFCVVFVALSLSKKPLEQGGETVAVENGNYHAVYMTPDELAGGIAFDLFRQQLEESGANAVLVDFKTADGNLVFPSTVQTAQDIGACTNAVQTAKDTVQTLQASGYAVIFRIYCFEDALAAAYLPGAAVTEADGKTVWLDDSAQNDGSGWLNPYSDTAKLYLLQIVDDAVSFGADVVLLDGVCFPSGRYLGRAVFAGEAQSTFSRNAVLQDFIEQVKKVTGDVPLAVSMSLSAALSGDRTLYGGGIFDKGSRGALFLEHPAVHAAQRRVAADDDADFEHLFLLAAVDGEHLMPLDLVDGRRKGVIVAVDGVLRLLFGGDGDDVRPLVVQLAQRLSHVGVVRDGLGNDVGRARKRFFDGGDPLFGIDVRLCRLLGRGAVGRLRIEQLGERREPLLAGDRGARAPLLFIGTVEVLDLGERLCLVDGAAQLFRHLALIFDGRLDLLPARLQIAQIGEAVRKGADGLVVHRAVHLLAVTCDKRHRVAFVQKGDDVLHIVPALSELLGQDLADRLHSSPFCGTRHAASPISFRREA